MYTRCPTCSTCFRVTDRHLAIANGKVRCGQCQLVFNALEHAIDNLPDNLTGNKPVAPVTPAPKTEIKKPLTPTVAPAPVAPTAKEKIEEIVNPAEVKKPEEPVFKKSVAETPVIETAPVETPLFNADATMITDIEALDKDESDNIDLDTHSAIQNVISEGDNLLDDHFDLNAAIDGLNQAAEDELTQAAEDKGDIIVVEEEPATTKSEKDIPIEDNSADVFKTDAYDATNASSVSDIMNEMEGQLPLDITEPDNDDEYDANHEFDFLKLNNESARELEDETKNENNEEKIVDEFEFIKFDEEDDEPIQEEHLDVTRDDDKTESENNIDEDELFDKIDLSDFEDSDVEESIVLEEPLLENSELQNIGQHADELDVPIQLRKDLEHLQTSSQRSWHPLLASSFIVVLLIFSFSQLAFFRAHDLVNQIPSSRPLLEAFCETIGCRYSGPRDIKQIQLLSRDVRLHPKEKNALLISVAMINNAYFAQPYPDIHIRLSDISGNVVAERIFNAKTYMGKLSNPFLLMKSKTPVHINFEVVDPGKDAVNFEFTFL